MRFFSGRKQTAGEQAQKIVDGIGKLSDTLDAFLQAIFPNGSQIAVDDMKQNLNNMLAKQHNSTSRGQARPAESLDFNHIDNPDCMKLATIFIDITPALASVNEALQPEVQKIIADMLVQKKMAVLRQRVEREDTIRGEEQNSAFGVPRDKDRNAVPIDEKWINEMIPLFVKALYPDNLEGKLNTALLHKLDIRDTPPLTNQSFVKAFLAYHTKFTDIDKQGTRQSIETIDIEQSNNFTLSLGSMISEQIRSRQDQFQQAHQAETKNTVAASDPEEVNDEVLLKTNHGKVITLRLDSPLVKDFVKNVLLPKKTGQGTTTLDATPMGRQLDTAIRFNDYATQFVYFYNRDIGSDIIDIQHPDNTRAMKTIGTVLSKMLIEELAKQCKAFQKSSNPFSTTETTLNAVDPALEDGTVGEGCWTAACSSKREADQSSIVRT